MKKKYGIVLTAVLCCIMSLNAGPGDIDMHGLNIVEVVQALYKAAKIDEWGSRCFSNGFLSRDEVVQLLQENFNHLREVKGRTININFSGSVINVCAFNQCNGEGVAERTLDALRKKKAEIIRD